MAKTKQSNVAKANKPRSIHASYSKSGRGRKEAFKTRRDTIFRKGKELCDSTGAYFLGLIYQPHRQSYHVCVCKDEGDQMHEWPFAVEEFLATHHPPPIVTEVGAKGAAKTLNSGSPDEGSSASDSDRDTVIDLRTVETTKNQKQPPPRPTPLLQSFVTAHFPQNIAQFSPLLSRGDNFSELFRIEDPSVRS
ncbi:hypothetical protein CLCR_10830 [Cladophialophora carrionii]|uniref:MADS-box domain-containing protein n=1 Tax=Cladophialophora carrionii TaxID=86049 RepID=A0A1C1CW99_9EURO|nr:hypothetical protein CLCR_10830 [Cladophialophora carrionii]